MTDLIHAGLALLCLGAIALAILSLLILRREGLILAGLQKQIDALRAAEEAIAVANRRDRAWALAREAVAYVEQRTKAKNKLDAEHKKTVVWTAQDRRDMARDYVRLQIRAHGWDFDRAALTALDEQIEAALGLSLKESVPVPAV